MAPPRRIFLGRSRELAELDAILGEASVRVHLLTLWGPGGAGKTTLARQCETRMRARGENVRWVELSSSRSRHDVHAALGVALGIDIDDDDADQQTETIARSAITQRTSIIADNGEQLDADARNVLIAIAKSMQQTHKNESSRDPLRVLITSRDAMMSSLRFIGVTDAAVRATVALNDAGQVVPNSVVANTPGLVEVRDDRHPWVRAFIAVTSHPFVAVTAPDGAFRFGTVPPGAYTLVVWQEQLGVRTRAVRVTTGVETRVSIEY